MDVSDDVVVFCWLWGVCDLLGTVWLICLWRSEKGASVLKVVASDNCRFALIDFKSVLFGYARNLFCHPFP